MLKCIYPNKIWRTEKFLLNTSLILHLLGTKPLDFLADEEIDRLSAMFSLSFSKCRLSFAFVSTSSFLGLGHKHYHDGISVWP